MPPLRQHELGVEDLKSNALLILSYLSRRESKPTGTCEFSKLKKSIGDVYSSDVLPHATTTLGSQRLLCTCYRCACFWLGTLLGVLYVVDSDDSSSHHGFYAAAAQVKHCHYLMSTAREIGYAYDLLVYICCCDYAKGHILLHSGTRVATYSAQDYLPGPGNSVLELLYIAELWHLLLSFDEFSIIYQGIYGFNLGEMG